MKCLWIEVFGVYKCSFNSYGGLIKPGIYFRPYSMHGLAVLQYGVLQSLKSVKRCSIVKVIFLI